MIDTDTSHTAEAKARGASAESRILLFFPFPRMPEQAEDMLNRISAASGIASGDLRYKLVGRGLTRLTPDPGPARQGECVAEMQAFGFPAALVPAEKIKNPTRLPRARKVSITDEAVIFYDRHDDPVLTVDANTELLVILADLSGKVLENQQLALHFGQEHRQKNFDEALKKISVSEPAAVFCKVGGEAPRAVFLDHAVFAYRSMQQHMDMSASVNFRNLVIKTIERAGGAVTDHMFGSAALAGARPDWQGSKNDVLAALNRYTRFMMAATEAGLLHSGANGPKNAHAGKTAPQDTFEAKQSENAGDERQPEKPLPPPSIQQSGIAGRVLALPYEAVYGVLFAAAAFGWFFLGTAEFNHPLLWRTALGIGLTGAGLLFFPYSLVLLNYKRMVKNTPTSRVRSVAMGMAELEGRARQYYDLRSSHSNTRCIYYRCMYFRRIRTSDGTRWRLDKITGSGRLPFYLEDDTGRILIRPKGALVLAEKARQEFWGGQNMWLSPKRQNRDYRIYEDLIAEGAKIYVLGAAGTERVGTTFRQRLVDRLRALKSDRRRLMKYDANQDGRIDETEWEAARTDMENMVHAETLAADTGPGQRVVIRKPGYGILPFIIANTEAAIIGKLALRVWIFLAGGLLMIALGAELLIRLWAG